MNTIPIWRDRQSSPHRFGALDRDCDVDVAVIGAGITGLTAAQLLTQSGSKVCLLERDRIGAGETGNTTAHLTMFLDTGLSELVQSFGEENAAAIWQAGRVAIEHIEHNVKQYAIECEFSRCPGYLHASLDDSAPQDRKEEFQSEAALARKLGFEAIYSDSVPIFNLPGYAIEDQAKFHPIRYLQGLASVLQQSGSMICEDTNVANIEEDDDKTVSIFTTKGKRVRARFVVIATHVPLAGDKSFLLAASFQTKLLAYSSYVVSGLVPTTPERLMWDVSEPYYYLRFDDSDEGTRAIFGGRDHKTGQAEGIEHRYQELEITLQKFIPTFRADRRWCGQVINTSDGLPFIGFSSSKQFVATGFNGNGITLGTIGGIMARDAILGEASPWTDLFAVSRKPIRKGFWKYLRENMDYPATIISDLLKSPSAEMPTKSNEGNVVSLGGQKVAYAIDEHGEHHLNSAVCPHMGCLVRWNSAERTWDCPCHGSRFELDGKLKTGPAETDLTPIAPSAIETGVAIERQL